jgi:hypothetical protein
MLDEKELRRPDWVSGVPVKLANGQEWHFPVPTVEMCPRFVDGRPKMWHATSFGPEFDSLVEAVEQSETGVSELLAIWGLAAFLVRLQYELTDADLSRLFRHTWGKEKSQAALIAILGVSVGQGPKPSPVGDA